MGILVDHSNCVSNVLSLVLLGIVLILLHLLMLLMQVEKVIINLAMDTASWSIMLTLLDAVDAAVVLDVQ